MFDQFETMKQSYFVHIPLNSFNFLSITSSLRKFGAYYPCLLIKFIKKNY